MDLDVKNLLSTNPSFLLTRLIEQYEKHGRLIVAYDFDDTVSPYWCASCTDVQSLLRQMKNTIDAYFIVYTCNKDHDKIKEFLDKYHIPYDAINENAPFAPDIEGKLFYNVFLDDKAGLGEVVTTLKQFLYLVRNGKIIKGGAEPEWVYCDMCEKMDNCRMYSGTDGCYYGCPRKNTKTENVIYAVGKNLLKEEDVKYSEEEQIKKGVEVMREIQEGKSRWINRDGKAPYICGSCNGASSKNYTVCPQCKKEMTNGDCAYTNKGSIIKEFSGKPFICIHDGFASKVEISSCWGWKWMFGMYKCENCGSYAKKPFSECPWCGATMSNGIKH